MRLLRGPAVALVACLPLVLLACTSHGYVVRTPDAPLYSSDEPDARIVARLPRLAAGYAGRSEPDPGDELVEVRHEGRWGYARRADLLLFSYPSNDPHAREHELFQARRSVILEEKDWPEELEVAILADRIENGMTREMVRLAWGHPSSIQTLESGGERWIYDRPRYYVHENVQYDWFPGGSRLYMGYGPFGPRWDYAFAFPVYEPRYYRTYIPYFERRTVTFSAAGTVTGWESDRF